MSEGFPAENRNVRQVELYARRACPCEEDESDICHVNAMCYGTDTDNPIPEGAGITPAGVDKPSSSDGNYVCSCYPEQLGHGYGTNGCANNGWNVRVVYRDHPVSALSTEEEANLLLLLGGIACAAGSINGCDHVHYTLHTDYNDNSVHHLGANVLFPNTAAGKTAAESAALVFNQNAPVRRSGTYPMEVDPAVGARVYTWTAGTTSDPIQVLPAGMQVDTVQFEPSCAKTGCWVIDVKFTVGHSDVKVEGMPMGYNTFYLPYAVGSDTLSYDYPYDTSVTSTFQPANFPCASEGTDLCCFGTGFTAATTTLGGDPGTAFLGKYRVTESFGSYASPLGSHADCATNLPGEPSYSIAQSFFEPGQKFMGMADSLGFTSVTVDDAFVGMFSATIKLDEKELRTRAGLLKGTVGVEHTVDTFLGYANFKPATLTAVLDAFAAQTAIHLEKTSFFSVSTHGTNAYTFLQYVNLRLIAIYQEDADFSGLDEASNRTVRTNSFNAAHFVQVTFTLGSKYEVNDNGDGLIPLDSVRAGQGTFFDKTNLFHKCNQWEDSEGSFDGGAKTIFDESFYSPPKQACAPNAVMCASPASVPDQFVAFNIPLGVDWFLPASSNLENNVFVDMVINAQDNGAILAEFDGADAPKDGGKAHQMKTTLTGSIPLVEGGINIFCDGVTAKTDLKDVSDADLIIGSASDLTELIRLTIFENITSTNLDEVDSPEINTKSIESGLMTLVLKGDPTYFEQSATTSGYSLELEDVITVHIMENNECTGVTSYNTGTGNPPYGCVFDEVKAMAAQPAEENDGDTDGYKLNDAFAFRIDRAANRAHLEPTPALAALCPLSPSAPAAGNAPLETCVSRRDVRFRGYPHRLGGYSTAMEILRIQDTLLEDEATFMTTVLSGSTYAKQLGRDFATAVGARYTALGHPINGRYNRAYWINPGYEWTPTQTGGESIFTLSQKIFMFALINLSENYVDNYVINCNGFADSVAVGSKCFFVPETNGQRNWIEAQAECVQRGANLASINSEDENSAIQTGLNGNTIGHWIGYTDVAVDGTWVWQDGSTSTYTRWHQNDWTEPNGGSSENCAIVWPGNNFDDGNMTWNDAPCSTEYNYICSAEPFAYLKPPLHLPALSRRMLLSTEGSGAGVGVASMSFKTSPKSMMANAFNVPEDRVATFSVTMDLTESEACLDAGMLQGQLRLSLEGWVETVASPFETLQVTSISVDKAGAVCPGDIRGTRRAQRVMLASAATADVEILIVFSAGYDSTINLEKLRGKGGIQEIAPLSVSPTVQLAGDPTITEKEEEEEEEVESSSNVGIIAGICGGVGGLLLLAGALFAYSQSSYSKGSDVPCTQVASAVSIENLKAELQSKV